MIKFDDLLIILSNVSEFLNQNDLVALSQVCRKVHDKVGIKKLYEKITITREPIIKSESWYLESNYSSLSGYREVLKTNDQNDLFLYDKIQRLLNSSHLHYINELIITDHVFNDVESGSPLLIELIRKLVSINLIESLEIFDSILLEETYDDYLKLTHLKSLNLLYLHDIFKTKTIQNVKSLQLRLPFDIEQEFGELINSELRSFFETKLKSLVINDVESSSLRFFQILHNSDIHLNAIESLKFNHFHGSIDYNSVARELSSIDILKVIDFINIKKLEMSIGCETENCPCFDEFLFDVSSQLPNLERIGLIENTHKTQGDHYTEENWDISIGRFLLSIPNVSSNLKALSINHNPPDNGEQLNAVDGNYFRRRNFYSELLPHFKALKTLSSPSLLLSLSAYDILIGDLLWNGCECDYCKKVLPILDEYIMNHQVYSDESGMYKDISVTNFFAYICDTLTKRFRNQIQWDLDVFNVAPTDEIWNFHGYSNIHHFEDYSCNFDSSVFTIVPRTVVHFFNGYMNNIINYLPNLQLVNLSGICYAVDKTSHTYINIYD